MNALPLPAARRRSPFATEVNMALTALAVLVVLGIGVWLVGARHAALHAAQDLCAQEYRAEVRRQPHLAHVVPAGDDCRTLARARGR